MKIIMAVFMKYAVYEMIPKQENGGQDSDKSSLTTNNYRCEMRYQSFHSFGHLCFPCYVNVAYSEWSTGLIKVSQSVLIWSFAERHTRLES